MTKGGFPLATLSVVVPAGLQTVSLPVCLSDDVLLQSVTVKPFTEVTSDHNACLQLDGHQALWEHGMCRTKQIA